MRRARSRCASSSPRAARAPGTPEPKAAALRAQSHKAIAHSFRWLQLGLQLLEAGRVTDYAVANGLSAELATCAFVAWSEYVAVYRPQYEALVSRYPAVASAKPASRYGEIWGDIGHACAAW